MNDEFNEDFLEDMDEDRVYQADELCFSIYFGLEEDMQEGCRVVYFSVLSQFRRNGYCDDNLCGYNIDKEALKEAGIATCEVAAGVFEIEEPLNEAEIFNNLIHAGFIFDEEFDAFMKGRTDSNTNRYSLLNKLNMS